MDWKQFISSVIGSIAWPVAVIAILLIFKSKIGHVISQIRKFAAGAGGVSIEIAEQVDNVRSAGEAVEAEQNTPEVVALDPETLALAKNFPGAAFLQSFKQLENVILQIRSRRPDDRPHRNLNEVMQQLRIKGHITAAW